MPSSFVQEVAGPDGWSDWIFPRTAENGGYKISCCDCGLVHNMELRVFNGNLEYRVKLNNRSTAAIRRERKKRGEPTP